LTKNNSNSRRPYGFGNTNRRLSEPIRRKKGDIARDRFAFEQTLQGNDCTKLRKGGDFVVQKRDFFDNPIGNPTVVDVKTGNSKVTAEEAQRRRRLGRDRHKFVRY
jgi:hypothetical protein